MKKTLYILGIILVMLLGAYFQYMYCCGGGCPFNNTEKQVGVKADAGSLALFSLKDGNFNLNCKENFAFRTSSYQVEQPIAPKLVNAMGKLKTYLAENPMKNLNIKGYYGAFEKNLSLFSNLGLARANAVRSYFINNGFNKKQLSISSEEISKINDGMSLIKGGTAYSFFVEDEDAHKKKLEELKLFREQLQKEPLTLYFKTGNSQLNLTQEERAEIKKIGEYLTLIDNSKLLIVGHTDNTGKSDMNKNLSQKRADFVKSHFVRNGFIASTIEAVGEGAAKPIATNKTEEGRAKNRRVTVTIK